MATFVGNFGENWANLLFQHLVALNLLPSLSLSYSPPLPKASIIAHPIYYTHIISFSLSHTHIGIAPLSMRHMCICDLLLAGERARPFLQVPLILPPPE